MSVIMLSVLMLSVILMSVIMLSILMLSVIIVSVIMLSVIILSVITVSAVAPFQPRSVVHTFQFHFDLNIKFPNPPTRTHTQKKLFFKNAKCNWKSRQRE
jgi:hypothetical protein